MSSCLCTCLGGPRTPAQSFPHTQHYSCKGHADASPKQSCDRSFIVSNGAVTPLPGDKSAPGCLTPSFWKALVCSPTSKSRGTCNQSRLFCNQSENKEAFTILPRALEILRQVAAERARGSLPLEFLFGSLVLHEVSPKRGSPPSCLAPLPPGLTLGDKILALLLRPPPVSRSRGATSGVPYSVQPEK